MKKHKLLLVLTTLLMGSAIFVSSCKDDEDTLGLIGSWKVTDATFNPPVIENGDTITDALAVIFQNPCDQDDFFIFEANNVFKEDEGATKCNSGDPQQHVGTYNHSGSTLSLITSDTSGGTTNYDTITLTNVAVSNTKLTGTVEFDSTHIVDMEMTRQ